MSEPFDPVAFRTRLRRDAFPPPAVIQYGECKTSRCDRIVPLGILYCCGPCAGPGQLAGHSAGCEERQAEWAPRVTPARGAPLE